MATKRTTLLSEHDLNLRLMQLYADVKREQMERKTMRYDMTTPIKISRSSRFYKLSPRVWERQVLSKQKYQFVHNVALENLQKMIVKRLSILYDTNICMAEPLYFEEALPNKLYSWDASDFYRRRALDTVWLDVLKRELSRHCLESRKFRNDLEEIRRYLRLITSTFLPGDDKKISKSKMFAYLKESFRATTIEDRIRADLKRNQETETVLSVLLVNTTIRKIDRPDFKENRVLLQNILMDEVVVGPLELRYSSKSYENHLNKARETADVIEGKLSKEIKYYNDQMDYERRCSRYTVVFFQSQIEEFKQRHTALSFKYEEEGDDLDHKISLNRIKLDKLKDQYQFMTDQLARFREELEQLRLEKEEKRRLELQRLSEQSALRESKARPRRKTGSKGHAVKDLKQNVGLKK